MKLDLRYQYFSRARYDRYLLAVSGNKGRAKRLYKANIRLVQSFHPLLSQFEVIFRNAVSMKMSHHFGDPDWIINQQNGFMSNRSLARSHYFLKKSVAKTEASLIRRKIPVTTGKVIADQTFGFWVAFFLPHHYSLIGGQSIYAFPHKPATEDRASIYAKLDNIRNFRNRANHCEPICFKGGLVDCSDALAVRKNVYDLASWIDPRLAIYLASLDNTQSCVHRIMNI